MKLLSFGADEDAGEDEEEVVFKKKSIVRPDCTFNQQPMNLFFLVTLTSNFFFGTVVENPRAVVAVPDFVSQPSASSKPLNVAKEIPKDPKVNEFFCFVILQIPS